jgi:hypothetical protein
VVAAGGLEVVVVVEGGFVVVVGLVVPPKLSECQLLIVDMISAASASQIAVPVCTGWKRYSV